MRRLSSLHWLFDNRLWLLLAVVASDSHAQQTPADRLIKHLDSIGSLHATFEQSSSRSEQQSGELWLQKPDRFRLETLAPLSQIIVSDGASLWIYDRDLEQVIIDDLDQRAEEMPILLLAGKADELVADYEVDFYADESREHFVLHPIDDRGAFGKLGITLESGLPVSVTIESTLQELVRIDFKVQGNKTLVEGLFTFQVPEGIDVIDDRQG